MERFLTWGLGGQLQSYNLQFATRERQLHSLQWRVSLIEVFLAAAVRVKPTLEAVPWIWRALCESAFSTSPYRTNHYPADGREKDTLHFPKTWHCQAELTEDRRRAESAVFAKQAVKPV